MINGPVKGARSALQGVGGNEVWTHLRRQVTETITHQTYNTSVAYIVTSVSPPSPPDLNIDERSVHIKKGTNGNNYASQGVSRQLVSSRGKRNIKIRGTGGIGLVKPLDGNGCLVHDA